MVGFFYMIYDFPCIINKPSFYVIDVHAVLIVKDITGTIQYQHYHLPPPPFLSFQNMKWTVTVPSTVINVKSLS